MGLNAHGFLRPHEYLFAVDIGNEADALLADFAPVCKRKHLKTAAVGENGLIPVHEFMQTAQFTYDFITRTDVQMVGVGKLHLTAYLA